ncbi:sporadic carbohydrate cluster 2OG-Fe(II) oxygenase [Candidatus Pelagibacter sp.]|uniref:sporadic carbohydrate cluster 2OG-Fe(II) oxygenase n=1 Tax=Candidatus Pelagibacter sp. TaxID=2024849 RepID=UPI003D0FE7C6
MFISDLEKKKSLKFINNGYLVCKITEKKSLEWITDFFTKFIKKKIPKVKNKEKNYIFNNLHKILSSNNLNSFRLSLLKEINGNINFKFHYYNVSKEILENIVGNELAMQKNINLSIQFPKDKSSLLTMHADTWSGDSPFEAVIWLPLVNVSKTKSMYILPQKKYSRFLKVLKKNKSKSTLEIYKKLKKDLIWLKVSYGELVIFNQSLPHGNIVNKEKETRLSMNCRFKGLYTPYGTKEFGDFFTPITMKAATKIGINYKLPKI